jgi:FkbM family methyltransferase
VISDDILVEPRLKLCIEKGASFHGLIHVGSNDGAEVEWYRLQGCRPIICFEPHLAALARASERYAGDQDVWFIGCALGAESGSLEMVVPADGDDEKTSRYTPIPTDGHEWTRVPAGERIVVPVMRFDQWADQSRVGMSKFNTLVVDAQGMEMEVLEGMGATLNWITYLSVELSAHPMYEGEVPADEVIRWLDRQGFQQISNVEEHDDVIFIRRGTLVGL